MLVIIRIWFENFSDILHFSHLKVYGGFYKKFGEFDVEILKITKTG